jgi:hypothetical protein
MEINGIVEVQGFTRICDLDDGVTFAFCDSNELFMKGSSSASSDVLYAISLADGTVYDIYDEEDWSDRPVRQIKTILTIH